MRDLARSLKLLACFLRFEEIPQSPSLYALSKRQIYKIGFYTSNLL